MRLIAATAPPAVILDISEAIVVRPFSKKHETHADARFSLGTMRSEKFREQGIGSCFQNLNAFLQKMNKMAFLKG
jgi:hypothetical protein